MSEEQNIDVYGSEPVSSIEVNNEPAEQADADNSSQDKKVPESIPYDRFQKVNSEKNEYKSKYEELQNNVNQYLANENSQSAKKQTEISEYSIPEINSVDDMIQYVEKRVEERIKPIEEQRRIETYTNNVETYFKTHSDANEIRSDIDSYYESLPEYRQRAIVEAISLGDTTVLDEIKNTVSLRRQSDISNMTNQAINSDAQKAAQPSATKVIRSGNTTFSDMMKEAKKNRDYTDVFKAMIG